MRVVTEADSTNSYGGRFSGRVALEMLDEATSPERADMVRVHFFDGAITNWHSHPGGQALLVVSGVARIGTEDETRLDLEPGSFISAPAGERHWHGAMPGHDCVLYAATYGTTVWEDGNPDHGQCC
jgi:quercetin dioxygenase-like cupin family protein